MEIIAKSKYIRMSPRKLRLVAEKLCGLTPIKALSLMGQMEQKGAGEIIETLRQAVANAENNFQLKAEDLKIKNIQIDGGPVYKRFQPISRGMAHSIKKRTAHLTIVLEGEKEAKNGTKS